MTVGKFGQKLIDMTEVLLSKESGYDDLIILMSCICHVLHFSSEIANILNVHCVYQRYYNTL